MPIYEYQCKKCGKKSAHMRGSTESTAQFCSDCSRENFKELISNIDTAGTGKRRIPKLSHHQIRGDLGLQSSENVAKWVEIMCRRTGEDVDRMAEKEMEKPPDSPGNGTEIG